MCEGICHENSGMVAKTSNKAEGTVPVSIKGLLGKTVGIKCYDKVKVVATSNKDVAITAHWVKTILV